MTSLLTAPVTVDIAALTVVDHMLYVLTARCGIEPFKDHLALPGGFLREGEQAEETAAREFEEETGITPPRHLEQLFSYGPEGCDPRGPVPFVAYLLLTSPFSPARSGGDATGVLWHPVNALLTSASPLAFNHAEILVDDVEHARPKIEYSPFAMSFYGPEFTITQLRTIYEAIWGSMLDPHNFHCKATETASPIEPTGGTVREGAGCLVTLYHLVPGIDVTVFVLDPPLRRPPAPIPASLIRNANAPSAQEQPSTEGEP